MTRSGPMATASGARCLGMLLLFLSTTRCGSAKDSDSTNTATEPRAQRDGGTRESGGKTEPDADTRATGDGEAEEQDSGPRPRDREEDDDVDESAGGGVGGGPSRGGRGNLPGGAGGNSSTAGFAGQSSMGGVSSALGGAGGGAALPAGGAGGAAPEATCEWSGFLELPFRLYFSDDFAAAVPFEAECELSSIAGDGPFLLGFACALDEGYGLSARLDVDLELAAGTPGAIEEGSRVRFVHTFLQGLNTENYGYAVFATEATANYEPGALLLGGVHGDEWGYLGNVLELVSVELGTELCADEPDEDDEWDCVRQSEHDLLFEYEGEQWQMPLGGYTQFGTDQPLYGYVSSGFSQTLGGCCFDCTDDLVVFGVWPEDATTR